MSSDLEGYFRGTNTFGSSFKRDLASAVDMSSVVSAIDSANYSNQRIADETGAMRREIAESNADLLRATEALSSMQFHTNELLDNLIDKVDNPMSTAAGERFRRGVVAFRSGWYREAREEFDAAIEQDRFHPLSHLERGMVCTKMDDLEEALRSYELCIRYSIPRSPEIGSAAALLGSSLVVALRGQDAAIAFLDDAKRQIPMCHEIWLLRGLLSGDRDIVAQAVAAAPDLGAVVLDSPNMEQRDELLATVDAQPDGPVAIWKALTHAGWNPVLERSSFRIADVGPRFADLEEESTPIGRVDASGKYFNALQKAYRNVVADKDAVGWKKNELERLKERASSNHSNYLRSVQEHEKASQRRTIYWILKGIGWGIILLSAFGGCASFLAEDFGALLPALVGIGIGAAIQWVGDNFEVSKMPKTPTMPESLHAEIGRLEQQIALATSHLDLVGKVPPQYLERVHPLVAVGATGKASSDRGIIGYRELMSRKNSGTFQN